MNASDYIAIGSVIISIASFIVSLIANTKTKNRNNYEIKRDTIHSLLVYLKNSNNLPAIDFCLHTTTEKPKIDVKLLEVNLRKCFSRNVVNQYDKIIQLIGKLREIDYSISRLIDCISDSSSLQYEKLKENLITYYSHLEDIEENYKRELFENHSVVVPSDINGNSSYNFYELLCKGEKIMGLLSKNISIFERMAYEDIKTIN